jgi:hypothetical protein
MEAEKVRTSGIESPPPYSLDEDQPRKQHDADSEPTRKIEPDPLQLVDELRELRVG